MGTDQYHELKTLGQTGCLTHRNDIAQDSTGQVKSFFLFFVLSSKTLIWVNWSLPLCLRPSWERARLHYQPLPSWSRVLGVTQEEEDLGMKSTDCKFSNPNGGEFPCGEYRWQHSKAGKTSGPSPPRHGKSSRRVLLCAAGCLAAFLPLLAFLARAPVFLKSTHLCASRWTKALLSAERRWRRRRRRSPPPSACLVGAPPCLEKQNRMSKKFGYRRLFRARLSMHVCARST